LCAPSCATSHPGQNRSSPTEDLAIATNQEPSASLLLPPKMRGATPHNERKVGDGDRPAGNGHFRKAARLLRNARVGKATNASTDLSALEILGAHPADFPDLFALCRFARRQRRDCYPPGDG